MVLGEVQGQGTRQEQGTRQGLRQGQSLRQGQVPLQGYRIGQVPLRSRAGSGAFRSIPKPVERAAHALADSGQDQHQDHVGRGTWH